MLVFGFWWLGCSLQGCCERALSEVAGDWVVVVVLKWDRGPIYSAGFGCSAVPIMCSQVIAGLNPVVLVFMYNRADGYRLARAGGLIFDDLIGPRRLADCP